MDWKGRGGKRREAQTLQPKWVNFRTRNVYFWERGSLPIHLRQVHPLQHIPVANIIIDRIVEGRFRYRRSRFTCPFFRKRNAISRKKRTKYISFLILHANYSFALSKGSRAILLRWWHFLGERIRIESIGWGLSSCSEEYCTIDNLSDDYSPYLVSP